MKIELRKDLRVKDLTIPKTTVGVLVAITWSDSNNEKYLVDFKQGRFEVDSKEADILKSRDGV